MIPFLGKHSATFIAQAITPVVLFLLSGLSIKHSRFLIKSNRALVENVLQTHSIEVPKSILKPTVPRSEFASPEKIANGYTVKFVGSSVRAFRRLRSGGGGGIDAALAKNASRKSGVWLLLLLAVEGGDAEPEDEEDGSSSPCVWSTQVPHPGQSLWSFEACSGPRCSVHPGQLQSKPQVHPEPASSTMLLSGGIAGNTGGGCGGEVGSEKDMESIGGSTGPRVGSC